MRWPGSLLPRRCSTKLYAAPGNPGIAEEAELVALDVADHAAVAAFCRDKGIDLVVVGPEGPLVAGIGDDLRAEGIRVFGPSGKAAQLEGSKGFTKDLCARYNIPTAAYGRFDDAAAARAYVEKMGAPIVIKADGLAAGKGVTVAMTLDEALEAVDACFDGAFGGAGAEVVVEEFLTGEEASFFCLCDGKTALPFGTAQDHKRVGDGDTGPNTGGMGAYSPAPVMTPGNDRAHDARDHRADDARHGRDGRAVCRRAVCRADDRPTSGPKLIEYNTRFGDPECQVLMMRLEGRSAGAAQRRRRRPARAHVGALARRGGAHGGDGGQGLSRHAGKGLGHSRPRRGGSRDGVEIFHAGTAVKDGELVANGGRVLNVTATGATSPKRRPRPMPPSTCIDWPEGFCRRDIGWRAVEREQAG